MTQVVIASTPANMLSNPRVRSMKKNRKDQIWGIGICRTASGYTTKASAYPLCTTFPISSPVLLAINPRIEKITNPAKNEVPQLMSAINQASL